MSEDKKERSGTGNGERLAMPSRAVRGSLSPMAIRRSLEAYTASCAAETGKDKRFPNMAGFARFLGISLEELAVYMEAHPKVYARVRTVLEDEALNSAMKPTVLSVYMKQRLGYDGSEEANEPIQVVFEHDIGKDGG